jgi:TP901 family phage tail tape measure protein
MSANDTDVNVNIGATNSASGVIQSAMNQFGGLWKAVGLGGPAGIIAAGGIAAVGAGLAVSIKQASQFQTEMTSLVTGAGESAANLSLVGDGIKNIAKATGENLQQLTSGMFMIDSAGYHGAKSLDILKAAAQGAKVGNADLGTVSDATTTILKDFGNSGITATGAVNTLIATVANGKTHMADLAGAMSQILPVASASKVGLNDVMGAMATMTGEGVPAANAATYLRQTLIALSAPTPGITKALLDVGLTTQQVSDSMKKSLPDTLKMITDAIGKKFPEGSLGYMEAVKAIAGGSKTIQGVLDLTGQHAIDFKNNVAAVSDQVTKGGTTIVGWSKVQGDLSTQFARFKEVLQVVAVDIGQKFLPVLTAVLKYISDLASGMSPVAKFLVTVFKPAFEAVATAIKTSLMPVIEAHKKGLEDLMKVFAVITGASLVTLVAVIYVAVRAFSILIQIVGEVIRVVADTINWFSRLYSTIYNTVSGFGNLLYSAGTNLIDGFIRGIENSASRIFDSVRNIGNKAVSALKGVLKIFSPSQVFADLGHNVGLGLAQGISGSEVHVTGAATKLGTAAIIGGQPNNNTSVSNSVNNNSSSSNHNVTIQNLTLQMPNGATMQSFIHSLNQDSLNVSRGLSPVQGAYNVR